MLFSNRRSLKIITAIISGLLAVLMLVSLFSGMLISIL